MPQTFKIQLAKHVAQAKIITAAQLAANARAKKDQAQTLAASKKQTQDFMTAIQALDGAAQQLNTWYTQAVAAQSAEISKLALQIAEKITATQIASGNYNIEAIICDVLSNAEQCEGVTVYVNPQDLASLVKLQQENNSIISRLKLAPDAALKPAECRIDTGKGIIESLLETRLKNIESALLGLESSNETHSN